MVKRGRKTKRKFPRTETLKVRMSQEHKKLLKEIKKEVGGKHTSDADIIESSLAHYGLLYALEPKEKREKRKE